MIIMTKRILFILGLILVVALLWRYGIIFIPLIIPFGLIPFRWGNNKKDTR